METPSLEPSIQLTSICPIILSSELAPLPIEAFVHLAYGLGAKTHMNRYKRGLVPDMVPYDFNVATTMGCNVSYSDDHTESKLARLLRRATIAIVGFDFFHAYRNRHYLLRSDIVWTMDERQYLAVLFLITLLQAHRKPKVIAQTIWLFNQWSQLSAIRRWYLRKLLRKADLLTVHTTHYLDIIREILPNNNPRLLHFGVSKEGYPVSEPHEEVHSPIRIFAAGNDKTRDWSTLLAAFGNDKRFEVVLISRSLKQRSLKGIENVRLHQNPMTEDFRFYYRWSDYVAIPMVENLYSGITVALEATRMGAPLVCSSTGGISTYFSQDEVLFVPSIDPVALREAILNCSPAARLKRVQSAQSRLRSHDYSSSNMVKSYVTLSREILDRAHSQVRFDRVPM